MSRWNFVSFIIELHKCKPCAVVIGTCILASWRINETRQGSMSVIGDYVPFRLLIVFLFIPCLIVPAFMSTLSFNPCLLLQSAMITISCPFLTMLLFVLQLWLCFKFSPRLPLRLQFLLYNRVSWRLLCLLAALIPCLERTNHFYCWY